MKKPAWSYSALDSFATCPRRHKLSRVDKKFVEPESDEIKWGNKVHKELELYVKTLGAHKLSKGVDEYQPIVDKLLAAPGSIRAEQQVALDRNFAPVQWFSKDAWCRMITDVEIINGSKAFVGDYKTGKRKPDTRQLALCAAGMFHRIPEVQTVTTAFLWLKTGQVDKETFVRDDLVRIWDEFLPLVKRFERAFEKDEWPAKPSGLCSKWCPVPKSECEFSGRT